MTAATVAVVVAGVGLAAAILVGSSVDPVTVVLGSMVVAAGLLALAVARKVRSGAVAPSICESCGGVVSATAPYCKHCGHTF